MENDLDNQNIKSMIPTSKPSVKRSSHNCLANAMQRLSFTIITKLENFFYWYGKTISKRPFLFILLCLLFTFLCSLGIMKFTKEVRPFKLWIPQDSDFIKVMEWQTENFPQMFRIHMAIYEAENVLNKSVILEMFRIHNAVKEASTENATWHSTCAKLPVIASSIFGKRKREIGPWSIENYNNKLNSLKRVQRQSSGWLSYLPRNDYCSLLKGLQMDCMEHGILEIWGYDNETLNSLTFERIIKDLNETTMSAVFGFETNFTSFLGGIERNKEGVIVGAKAAFHMWTTQIDKKAVEKGDFKDDGGTGTEVDIKGYEWESELIKVVLNNSERPQNVNVYLMSSSSFGQISGSTIVGDAKYFGLGFAIVFIYVQIMLGKFNMIEQRPLLSFFGISCVWLSMGVSYGLCSLSGVKYGPVNNVLPFLLLGLGVDDMFVIMQAWNNLTSKEKEAELSERIGHALKNAGVSITITSLTDFVAFAIGCTTVLPALRSFCLYAAVGILSIYVFQATYFVAWFSLDQRRLEDSRQGLLWCWKIKNHNSNKCSQKDYCQLFFKNIYAKYLLKRPVKIVIIFFTLSLCSASLWGLYNLKQEFNPIWFIPQSSYLFKFFKKLEEYFPSNGEDGLVFFGTNGTSIIDEIPKLDSLVEKLKNNEYISKVDSWRDKFESYWNEYDINVLSEDYDKSNFLDDLSEFLHSPTGSKYRLKNFKFNGTLNCSDPAPPVLAFSIEYRHNMLYGSKQKIDAMEAVKSIVLSMNFSGYVKPWARAYSTWETDKIIQIELLRNLGMAMIVIGVMTLALIASISTSFMVLLCVILTLIDVGALMHWWGLTIDTVSCIDLVLAVGLCVDYAAHIGHTFMTQRGSRNQRAKDTLAKIGPAVLNGGVSTFLAFLFLAGSDSHVFKTFFKIFFAVCLYGLYHGLVFLPVLLSIIGPPAYSSITVTPSRSIPNLELESLALNNSSDHVDKEVVMKISNTNEEDICCDTLSENKQETTALHS